MLVTLPLLPYLPFYIRFFQSPPKFILFKPIHLLGKVQRPLQIFDYLLSRMLPALTLFIYITVVVVAAAVIAITTLQSIAMKPLEILIEGLLDMEVDIIFRELLLQILGHPKVVIAVLFLRFLCRFFLFLFAVVSPVCGRPPLSEEAIIIGGCALLS